MLSRTRSLVCYGLVYHSLYYVLACNFPVLVKNLDKLWKRCLLVWMILTLEIKKFINKEHESMELAIIARVITDRYVNPHALLKVFQRVWTKKRDVEIKVHYISLLFLRGGRSSACFTKSYVEI